MKKSVLAIILTLVTVLCLSACGNNLEHAKTNALYAQGLEVIQIMTEMIQTQEYVDIITGGNNDIRSIAQNISTGDFSNPKAVYAISVDVDNFFALTELNSLNNASDGLKSFFKQRVLGSLMTQVNSMTGTANLATASVFTAGKTFVDENATENVIYLYTYENAVPVAVTFIVGEDHAVSASGVFVMYDGFISYSADEIKFSINSFLSGIDVEISEVFPEK